MSFKNFINREVFFRIGELVMGTNTLAYQAAINKMLKWSRKEIISWQEKKTSVVN